MNSSSETWAPALDLTRKGMAQFDPERVRKAIEDGFETGMNAGRAEALAAGRAQVQEELASLRARAEQIFATLARTVDGVARHEAALNTAFTTTVADTAVRVAGAILGRELADDTVAAMAGVERAIAGLGAHDGAVVRLHPDDLPLVSSLDLPTGVVLEGDVALRPGDAMVQTPDKTIDARLEMALARALTALEGGS